MSFTSFPDEDLDRLKLGSPPLDAPDSDFEEDYEPDYLGEFPHRKKVDDDI